MYYGFLTPPPYISSAGNMRINYIINNLQMRLDSRNLICYTSMSQFKLKKREQSLITVAVNNIYAG